MFVCSAESAKSQHDSVVTVGDAALRLVLVVHATRHVARTTFWFVDTHRQTDRHVGNNTSFRCYI